MITFQTLLMRIQLNSDHRTTLFRTHAAEGKPSRARPRTPIGTFGSITTRRTDGGRYVARTR